MKSHTTLIDARIESRLASVAYAPGHGVAQDRLGLALLYYTLPYALRGRTAVCLGSGGGLVPELMRRAQLDLALVGSRTYLVDAIVPEAGYGGPEVAGGWMDRRDAFRDPETDIWLLNTLTETAGREFFSRLGRPIDILHIDADHSYSGARLDFDIFTPMLSPHGVVTMHDLRMPGISRLVDEILASGTWDALRFADVGQGLAVLRRRQYSLPDVVVGKYNRDERDGTISVAVPEVPKEDARLWKYLTNPVLYARHAILAQWIDKSEYILEIGGYVTPIGPFLPHTPHSYVLVDPLCEPYEAEMLNGEPCRVRYVQADIDSFDLNEIKGCKYTVVFLGAQLDASRKSFEDFIRTVEHYIRIVAGAERAIIEFPPAWVSCRELFDCLISMLRPRIEFEATLDLSQNMIVVDGIAVPAERLVRRLFVLSGFAELPQENESRGRIARILKGADAEALLAPEKLLPVSAALDDAMWQPTHDVVTLENTNEGTLVVTPPVKWHYAAFLRLNEAALGPGKFVVEVEAVDCVNHVYAAIASHDLTKLSEQRCFVPSSDGRAKITLEGPGSAGFTTVLLRTGAEDEAGQVRIVRMVVRQ